MSSRQRITAEQRTARNRPSCGSLTRNRPGAHHLAPPCTGGVMGMFSNLAKTWSARRSSTRRQRSEGFVSGFEPLESRLLLAVTAFSSVGALTVIGDAQDNAITVSRNAAGAILVNNGAVPVIGTTPTVANTALIQVLGLGGNDALTLNEANGALPAANLFGGAGNDTLTGGSGRDLLFGQSGNDTL